MSDSPTALAGAGAEPAAGGERLRILIANETQERLERLTSLLAGLGHEIVPDAAPPTAGAAPDVALVGCGADAERALGLIASIGREAVCPVIALLDAPDPAYVAEAARRGVFAYVANNDNDDDLRSALAITLQRFAEYERLRSAFARRATTEQAKGILMARHGIDADAAFELLRRQSRRSGRKLQEVARAVIDSHLLLAHDPPSRAAPRRRRPPAPSAPPAVEGSARESSP